MYTSKRKILIPLPPSGVLARKKQLLLIRIAIALFVIIFIVVQLNVINYGKLAQGVVCELIFYSLNSNLPSMLLLISNCNSLDESLLPIDFHQPNVEALKSNNDTTQAILSAIPSVLHKYLKPKNNSQGKNLFRRLIIFQSLINTNIGDFTSLERF